MCVPRLDSFEISLTCLTQCITVLRQTFEQMHCQSADVSQKHCGIRVVKQSSNTGSQPFHPWISAMDLNLDTSIVANRDTCISQISRIE